MVSTHARHSAARAEQWPSRPSYDLIRDATDGVPTIKQRGGVVLAQDEASSEVFGMPRSAIETGCVDRILPLGDIAPALIRLARTGAL